MRILKSLPVFSLFAVIVAGVLLWRLPADFVYRQLHDRLAPLALAGVHGTLWQGHADSVSFSGSDLGALEWRLDPVALLGARVAGDVRLEGSGIEAAGGIIGESGILRLRDFRFSVPASRLVPSHGLATQAGGILSGVIEEASLRGNLLQSARGTARWSDPGIAALVGEPFPDLVAAFVSQPDGSLAGTIHDGGEGRLAVQGDFAITLAAFSADLVLRARDGDPELTDRLQYIGAPQGDGSTRLQVRVPWYDPR